MYEYILVTNCHKTNRNLDSFHLYILSAILCKIILTLDNNEDSKTAELIFVYRSAEMSDKTSCCGNGSGTPATLWRPLHSLSF